MKGIPPTPSPPPPHPPPSPPGPPHPGTRDLGERDPDVLHNVHALCGCTCFLSLNALVWCVFISDCMLDNNYV